MDLLLATHQADQAPWSDGPQQAIAVGSLIRLLVMPYHSACIALLEHWYGLSGCFFRPVVCGLQVAVHTWVGCKQTALKAQCMGNLTPDM